MNVYGSFGRTLSRRPDDPSPKSSQITPRPRSAFKESALLPGADIAADIAVRRLGPDWDSCAAAKAAHPSRSKVLHDVAGVTCSTMADR